MHRILIDLDASCVIGARSGFKVTSSAFFLPEIARFELEKASGKVTAEIIASEVLDIWHLGLMLLQVRKCNVIHDTRLDNDSHPSMNEISFSQVKIDAQLGSHPCTTSPGEHKGCANALAVNSG